MDEIRKTKLQTLVRQYIEDLIASGNIIQGEKMYSVRELSKKLGIGHLTVALAIRELVRENILESRKGVGTFVSFSLPYKFFSKQRKQTSEKKTLYYFLRNFCAFSSYHNAIYQSICEAAEQRDWIVKPDLISDRKYEEALADPQLAGVIYSCASFRPKVFRNTVGYGMAQGSIGVPYVTPDNFAAGYETGELLISAGYKTICYVSAVEKDPMREICRKDSDRELNFIERWNGLCEPFYRNRLPLPAILHWGFHPSLHLELESFLKRLEKQPGPQKLPPVLVVGNHSMCQEIYGLLSQRKLRIPQDIGLITYVQRSSFPVPLDTFDFNRKLMGKLSVHLIEEQRKGNMVPLRTMLPMQLHRKGSLIL